MYVPCVCAGRFQEGDRAHPEKSPSNQDSCDQRVLLKGKDAYRVGLVSVHFLETAVRRKYRTYCKNQFNILPTLRARIKGAVAYCCHPSRAKTHVRTETSFRFLESIPIGF